MSLRSELIALVRTAAPVCGTVYDDDPPDDAGYPFVSVRVGEGGDNPVVKGDARTIEWSRAAALHLWQERAAESDSLRDALVMALNGATLPAPHGRIRILSAVRSTDPTLPLAQWVVSIQVRTTTG